MARTPTLTFDRGTLLLHPPPRGKAWMDFAEWDDRVERFRLPAPCYRHLLGAMRADGTALKDEARAFREIEITANHQLVPYPHQTDALAAWKNAGRRGVVVLPTDLMLPGDLLIHQFRQGGSVVVPRRLKLDAANLGLASGLIGTFEAAVGTRRGELNQTLSVLEGEDTAFKVKRGLAHILANDFATFEIVAPIEPTVLRKAVFAQGASGAPSRQRCRQVLQAAAEALLASQNILLDPDAIAASFHADLPENHVLTSFTPPEPDALLHRYNLAQAQGVFYRAFDLTVTAHRNEPGQYKQLFRYVKLFGLMTLIEGDAEHGFTLRLDGPTSLFQPSTR